MIITKNFKHLLMTLREYNFEPAYGLKICKAECQSQKIIVADINKICKM